MQAKMGDGISRFVHYYSNWELSILNRELGTCMRMPESAPILAKLYKLEMRTSVANFRGDLMKKNSLPSKYNVLIKEWKKIGASRRKEKKSGPSLRKEISRFFN